MVDRSPFDPNFAAVRDGKNDVAPSIIGSGNLPLEKEEDIDIKIRSVSN